MPLLASAPWRPLPEVELLKRTKLTIEDAVKKVADFMQSDGERLSKEAANIGARHVSVKNIEGILDQLQQHWVGRSGADRPAECFVEVCGRLEVHLHPRFIGEKLASGLNRHACEILLRYIPTLGCIPLSYSNVRPTGSHGALVAESPWVHFLVDFRAVGFVPKKGQRLLGTSQKVGQHQAAETKPEKRHKMDWKPETWNGLNLKVLGYFNCFVKADKVPKDIQFNNEMRGWIDKKGQRIAEESSPIWLTLDSWEVAGESHSVQIEGSMEWPPAKQLRPPKASTASSSGAAGTGSGPATAQDRGGDVRQRKRQRQDDHEDGGKSAPSANGDAAAGGAEAPKSKVVPEGPASTAPAEAPTMRRLKKARTESDADVKTATAPKAEETPNAEKAEITPRSGTLSKSGKRRQVA